MQLAADGDGDRLSSGNRALRQIGGEANGLAIMAGAHGVRQLRSFSGYGAQFKRPLAAQKYRNQPRPQKQPKPIGKRLNHRSDIGSSVQSSGDFSQDFSPAMLLTRRLAQPRGFEQAAHLSSQNGSFRGEILVEKHFFGIVQKGRR